MNETVKKIIKWGGIGLAIVILFPFSCVPEGKRGLRFTFGKVSDTVLTPGVVFKLPFVHRLEKLPVTPLVIEKNIEVGASGAITKDNQTIGADIKVFYRYQTDKLVLMWAKYGVDRINELVAAAITESFKVVVGEHHIFELPTMQNEIRQLVINNIKAKMADYPVDITDVNILNYDWSDEFDKQISETMHRAQQVKQKEQELLITEQEAQKLVKQAEAEKNALVTKSEGQKEAARLMADAKMLEGEGIRKYNQSVQANMELELKLRQLEIEKIKAEKWTGQLVPSQVFTPIPLNLGATMRSLESINK